MTKTLIIGLVLFAFAHASPDSAKKTSEEVSNKSDFAKRLEGMKYSDLNGMNSDELKAFKAHLEAQKTSELAKVHGILSPYNDQIDGWLRAIDGKIEKPDAAPSISPEIPMHKRSMGRKEVIDIFKVTETQLSQDSAVAQRFYKELQEMKAKKNGSYKTQLKTKEQVDKWVAWLEENGFGDSDADASPISSLSIDNRSAEIIIANTEAFRHQEDLNSVQEQLSKANKKESTNQKDV